MAAFTFKRTLAGLSPADDVSAQRLKQFAVNDLVQADIKLRASRSLAWHRRYWALCNLIWQNSDEFKSAAEVHLLLKMETGLVKDLMLRSSGEVVKVPDSIAFDKMQPDEWPRYWNRVVAYVHEHVLVGVGIREIEEEIARVAV